MRLTLKYIIIFILLYSIKSTCQVYTLYDFGSNEFATNGNWNNIIINSSNQEGLSINLIDFDGNYTGETLTLTDSFHFINSSGTTNPDINLPFPNTTTNDSFFGELIPFSGNTNPTGGFTLNNLDPTKYYSFSVFSSRMGVSDNRETIYTISGQNNVSNSLNPSNNTTNTADIFNIVPNSDGTIVFHATAGVNNNNSFGFYYLGTIKMVSSTSQINNINESYLSLIYPNGGEQWEVGKIVSISWQSYGLSDIILEYSTNNGNSWNSIATVPSINKKYNWTIPSTVSDECIVRVSSDSLTDFSDTNFSIIEDEDTIYKIIVLGSSTSAGTGPNNIENAWVTRYDYFLNQLDTRFEVENLAVGGFTTYNVLPTGTTIPSDVIQTIAIEHNITKALSLNPNGIIINLPSNDAAHNYPSNNQIANYHLIRNTALALNIPVWISSPQPKNFGNNTNGLAIQLEMLAATSSEFNEFTFDFWSELGTSNNNDIKSLYNADGTHMNDTGHRILFDRVVAKNIHITVKNQVDANLSVPTINSNELSLNIYPNPVKNDLFISFSLNSKSLVKIEIFDSKGILINSLMNEYKLEGDYNIKVSTIKNKITNGIYFIKITTNKNTINKKLILV